MMIMIQLVNTLVFLFIINISLIFTEGIDYVSGPYSVIIFAGMTQASFNILIIDDNVSEANEKFTLTIISSSQPSRVTITDPAQLTVIIEDEGDGKRIYLWMLDSVYL